MDGSTKLYTKAVNYYNEGFIDKALDYCEKSISENIKNRSAINLKGLLYYLKGELQSAQALWKMNYQVNGDLISKKYLEDSRNDDEKKILYMASVKAMKEIKIHEALQMLKKCSESDFNCISVSNYIALGYIRLGEYDIALRYLDKVLKIDRNNKTAKQSKKELTSLGVLKRKFNFKYVGIGAVAVALTITAIFIFRNAPNITSDRKSSFENKANVNDKIRQSNDDVKEQQEDKKNNDIFPSSEFTNAIQNKDYDKLYELVVNWKDKELNTEEKNLLEEGKKLLADGGVEYFYNKGRQALAGKDYNSAAECFTKSYNYGQLSYLYSHIIYMLGASYKDSGNLDNAIKYYKEYDSKYPSGDYEDAVLYDLALIYKNIDNKVAKDYAVKLDKLYPKSIYDNSIIKGLITR